MPARGEQHVASLDACPPRGKALGARKMPGMNAVALMDSDEVDQTLRAVLRDVLGLTAERVKGFSDMSPLFGALPEFDSMAVAGLLTELEERLGITIEDDDVDADMLETYGALLSFTKNKALQ
jgi:acyl carrier protein